MPTNFSIKFRKWERECIFLGTPLSETLVAATFIDMNLHNHTKMQKTSSKISNLLYQSIAHKLLTPVNSVKGILNVMHQIIKPSNEILYQNVMVCKESLLLLEKLINGLQVFTIKNVEY